MQEYALEELPSRLGNFTIEPAPPTWHDESKEYRTLQPTDAAVYTPLITSTISVPSTSVSSEIFRRLLSERFLAHTNLRPLPRVVTSPIYGKASTDQVAVEDSPLNRLILQHALTGIFFSTIPRCIRTLLKVSGSPTLEEALFDVEASVTRFSHSMLALNLHALSALLRSDDIWTFTLAIEPSPYFGFTGVEARVILHTASKGFLSFHLLGLSCPTRDIPFLEDLLSTLCPEVHRKLLGIVTTVNRWRPHPHALQVMTSYVLAHFQRNAPVAAPFLTPKREAEDGMPPLLPRELSSQSAEEFDTFVDEHRTRLRVSGSMADIDVLRGEYDTLCRAHHSSTPLANTNEKHAETRGPVPEQSSDKAKGSIDHGIPEAESREAATEASGRNMMDVDHDESARIHGTEGSGTRVDDLEGIKTEIFENAWLAEKSQYPRLYAFVSGLATFYTYEGCNVVRGSMARLEDSSLSDEEIKASLELMLQARQFLDLRELVLTASSATSEQQGKAAKLPWEDLFQSLCQRRK